MQKFLAYSFAVYFASLGLSPIWGAHLHHGHEQSSNETHAFSHETQLTNISSSVLSVLTDKDEKDNCARFCDDCTIESLLGHLLENKTFFRATSLILVPLFDASNLAYHCNVDNQYLNRVSFVAFASTIPPPILEGRHIHSISPRGPPLV